VGVTSTGIGLGLGLGLGLNMIKGGLIGAPPTLEDPLGALVDPPPTLEDPLGALVDPPPTLEDPLGAFTDPPAFEAKSPFELPSLILFGPLVLLGPGNRIMQRETKIISRNALELSRTTNNLPFVLFGPLVLPFPPLALFGPLVLFGPGYTNATRK